MKYNKFLAFVVILTGLILTTKAQDTTTLHNEEIFVIRTYEPTVIEAEKISIEPIIKDTFNLDKKVDFKILAPHLKTTFNVEPIKPARISNEETQAVLQNIFLKLGFGNYTTPIGELYINNRQSKKYSVGGYTKHLSSKGEIKDTYYPECSKNGIGVYGKKFNKKNIMFANIDFERHAFNYYGYDANYADTLKPILDIVPKTDFKQYFWGINTKVGITNNSTDSSKFNYKTQIGHSIYSDKYDITENNYKISNNIYKLNKRNSRFDSYSYGINLDFNYNKTTNKDSLMRNTVEESVLFGQPYLTIRKDAISIFAGLNNYISFKDNNSKYYFSPELNINLNVANIFIPYVGVSGKYEQSTYKSLTIENPYMIYTDSIISPNKKISFYGGIKGNFTKLIYYDFNADYSQYDNMYFFVNPEYNMLNNRFGMVYSDADILKLSGSFNYLIKDKINIGLGIDYYNYSIKDTIEAWQKPTFDVRLFAEYHINKNIKVSGIFIYKGERAFRFAETVINTTDTTLAPVYVKYHNNKLKPYLDFNLACEYKYSNTMSAFININNFLNQRNYLWGNYPSQKLNFIIGITYSL